MAEGIERSEELQVHSHLEGSEELQLPQTSQELESELSKLLGHTVTYQLRITPAGDLALIDITMIFTGLTNNRAAEAVHRILSVHPEVTARCGNFKFPGRGQKRIQVLPLAHAISFAFLLPGKTAAKMRSQAAQLLVRYIGGDESLIPEISANGQKQEVLAAKPEVERTPEEQLLRLCGEAVETLHVPQAPLVIRHERSIALPGNGHLYAALRVGEDIIKIGISKDVLECLTELQRSFQAKYELLAVWPGEELLEDLVLDKLKPYKAAVGTSREHFNSQVTIDHVCKIVDHARDLYQTKMALHSLDFEKRKRELEFHEDLKDRMAKRQRDEARENILHSLVEQKNGDAIQVFLARLSAT